MLKVSELIEKLERVKDKNIPVVLYDIDTNERKVIFDTLITTDDKSSPEYEICFEIYFNK